MTRPPDAAFAHPSGPSDELPEVILGRAVDRAKEDDLAYAGAVTPAEACTLMQTGKALLIDVRTRFEHEYVGRVPDTPLIEWKQLGATRPSPQFIEQLRSLEPDRERNVLFLCRSGVRSHAAAIAATEAGYTHAFNILEGFEGDVDEQGHRGTRGGWRKAGLPWVQS